MSATSTLARFLASTAIQSIPRDAFDAAKRTLVDTVGVALAGLSDPAVALVDQWIATSGKASTCTVWGSTTSTSIADAAFANGVRAHALDFDDSLPSLNGHPSAVLWPTILAVGESVNAPGCELLLAYILGLEVAGKLGRAVGSSHYAKGWHPTATVGVLAATAAAGRLWKLSPHQMETALGIAASQTSGLIFNFGSMTKPLHVGQAARNGAMSAFLAKSGFTATQAAFDIKRGYLDVYAGPDGIPLASIVDELGSQWEISTPGIYTKRWPCCYCTYRPIGGLLELLEKHEITVDNVTEIRIGFPPGTADALITATPTTGALGKFSTAYVLASLIADRQLSLNTFTDANVRRPSILRLMEKIKSYEIPDSKSYNANIGYADITVQTSTNKYELRVNRTPGSPEWPMTSDDLTEKFHLCCDSVTGSERASEIIQLINNLREIPSVTQLTSLLSFDPNNPNSRRYQ